VPDGEQVAAVEALLHGMGGLSHFERYRQDTALVRDIVVCTHGMARAVTLPGRTYPPRLRARRRR